MLVSMCEMSSCLAQFQAQKFEAVRASRVLLQPRCRLTPGLGTIVAIGLPIDGNRLFEAILADERRTRASRALGGADCLALALLSP